MRQCLPYAASKLFTVVSLLSIQCAFGQVNPWEIPKPGTYKGSVENQRRQQQEETRRQQQSPSEPATPRTFPPSGGAGAGQEASRAAYEMWDKRPALLDSNNPLLGRWSWQPIGTSGVSMQNLFDGGTANAMGCSMVFGGSAVEFRTNGFVNLHQGRESPGGSVAYRGGGKQVIALQRDGPRLFMQFDFVAPDRISLSGVPCVMSRVGGARSVLAEAPGMAPQSAGFEVLGVVLGRSGPNDVRKNIAARGARPLIGRAPDSQELRIEVHDRKYGHPQLANVWYDFKDGVLASVTIIWERDPALFGQRAKFLTQSLGLAPPQQTSMQTGKANGANVVLVDDAGAGLVKESYSLAP